MLVDQRGSRLTPPKPTDSWPPFDWDATWYLKRYPDIALAISEGKLADPLYHFLQTGFLEGRFPCAAAEEQAREGPDVSDSRSHLQVSLGAFSIPLNWPVKGEIRKTFMVKLATGFFRKYMSGAVILDVGYKGGHADAVPIFPHAIGVDLDYPGYDGVHFPFSDESVDVVFASHVLEHTPDPSAVLREWFRVIKVRGFIVCIVPHQFLYERKNNLPSLWSQEHLSFYTPARLLHELENTLKPNTYRVRHLADNDVEYKYDISPDCHPSGCYEIELVVEKIEPPFWELVQDQV
jgi:SAM-dependent methyltransferase